MYVCMYVCMYGSREEKRMDDAEPVPQKETLRVCSKFFFISSHVWWMEPKLSMCTDCEHKNIPFGIVFFSPAFMQKE